MMSPGRISSIGPPSRCARPQPDMTNRVLAERMGMPSGSRTRLKRHAGADDPRWMRGLKHRIDSHGAGKIVVRPFAGRLRPCSLDVHILTLVDLVDEPRRLLAATPMLGQAGRGHSL